MRGQNEARRWREAEELQENVLCQPLCFCLGCGIWKVVWSQQAFFGVLITDGEVERLEF